MKRLLPSFLALLLTAAVACHDAASAAAAAPAAAEAAPLDAIAAKIPGAKPTDLRTTPIAGIYEYRRGAELAYVTADGRYAFAGDLYQLADNTNLSDTRRRELRRAMVGAVAESGMVVFAPRDPKNVKYTVTVFTDMDCAYCRALHKQIDEYNRLGIRVRYVAFPRSGPATPSWTRAEQVWCAADRNAMLTRAKQSEMYSTLPGKVCSPNPVAEHYALGKAIGLTGTPGIITESGELLPGYLPPQDLLTELKTETSPAVAAR
jgi:thiol:disulfide interchange protein DsbC